MTRWMRAVVVLAVLAVALPAFASAAAARTRVRVVPATGTPTTRFSIRFRNPIRTGRAGSTRVRELLEVSTRTTQTGCVSSRTVTLAPGRAARRLRIRLGPGRRGAAWCTGRYGGRLVKAVTLDCRPHLRCPAAEVAPRTLARFSFRVSVATGGPGPSFGGLTTATECPLMTGPPAVVVQGELVSLSWSPASDPTTPASQITYEIFYSPTSGGENYSSPLWTTGPGATSYSGALGVPGPAYFVVRARDQAGRTDSNTVERQAVYGCG